MQVESDNFHIIEDNFFGDPYKIRERGIQAIMNDHSCIMNDCLTNYPGVRSFAPKDIQSEIKKFITNTFQKDIIDFNAAAFHITSRIHEFGLVHSDGARYAGLIYLNENPPPKSGTILCSPMTDDFDTPGFVEASTTHDIDEIKRFVNFKKEYNSRFKVEVELENKFNRLLIYNGEQYHAPYHYFGNNLFNSRFVLVFWFQI